MELNETTNKIPGPVVTLGFFALYYMVLICYAKIFLFVFSGVHIDHILTNLY